MSDTFLPGSGFDTYEEQDKVLVGLCGGRGCRAAVRILQQQGFAVAGAVVRLTDADDTVQAAKDAAKALGIECVTLNASELASQLAEEALPGDLRFPALLAAADRLGIQYHRHHHRVGSSDDQPGMASAADSDLLFRIKPGDRNLLRFCRQRRCCHDGHR